MFSISVGRRECSAPEITSRVLGGCQKDVCALLQVVFDLYIWEREKYYLGEKLSNLADIKYIWRVKKYIWEREQIWNIE